MKKIKMKTNKMTRLTMLLFCLLAFVACKQNSQPKQVASLTDDSLTIHEPNAIVPNVEKDGLKVITYFDEEKQTLMLKTQRKMDSSKAKIFELQTKYKNDSKFKSIEPIEVKAVSDDLETINLKISEIDSSNEEKFKLLKPEIEKLENRIDSLMQRIIMQMGGEQNINQ